MSVQVHFRINLVRVLLLLCAVVAIGSSVARAQQATEADDGRVRVETNLIGVTVTVTDARGRNLSALDRNAFNVFDDNRQQEITFFSADDTPVSVVVLFDLSGSITPQKLSRARAALRTFFENSHPRDEFSLIGFSQEAEVLSAPGAEPEALLGKLSLRETRGQTALYDACLTAVRQVRRGAYPRRAILLISDGEDNSSRATLGELRRELKEEDVMIYAVGINDRVESATVLGRTGRNTLEEITGMTGGRAFFPRTPEELSRACEQVALELRSRYQLAYRPSSFTQDGKWHKVKVTVASPAGITRPSVRYKGGYYASPRKQEAWATPDEGGTNQTAGTGK